MTSQALQVSSNFRELEKKYGALTSILSSQSQFLSRLEKQCQCGDPSQSQAPEVRVWLSGRCCCRSSRRNTTPCFQRGTKNDLFVFFSVPVWTGDECAAEDPA